MATRTSTGCFDHRKIKSRSSFEHRVMTSACQRGKAISIKLSMFLSPGFSVNISSCFNTRRILYWHGGDTLIYTRRQLCKYLWIFVFIIRYIYFLVSAHICLGQWTVPLSRPDSKDESDVSYVLFCFYLKRKGNKEKRGQRQTSRAVNQMKRTNAAGKC